MGPTDDGLLVTLVRGVVRRRALFVFLTAFAVWAVILESLAVSPWAYAVYEGLGVRWLWPAVVLSLATLYLGAGIVSHRQNGSSQFFPFLALLALAILAFAVGSWLLDTAAEWSLFEATVALAGLGLAAVPAAIGYVGYRELWRTRWNRETVAVVLRTLPGGENYSPQVFTRVFDVALPKSKFRKITDTQKEKWASEHCLRIVEEAFAARKRRVLGDPIQGIRTEGYDLCLRTGDDLFHYYRLQWPKEFRSPEALRGKILALLRELVTIWLEGTEEQRRPHDMPAQSWVDELGKSADPYYRFLSVCFDLGRRAKGVSEPESIEGALSLYHSMHEDAQSVGQEPAERITCQNTWLALAHRSIGEQPCYDAWMAMRRIEQQGPLIPAPKNGNADVALLLARAFLGAHYAIWAQETHEDWRQGLEGNSLIMQED